MKINIFTRLLKNYKSNIIKFLDFIDDDVYYNKDDYTCNFLKLKSYSKDIDDILFNDDNIRLEIMTLKYKNINDYIVYL